MIKVFGHRALLEWWKPEATSRIIQPDISGQHDVLRWGKVTAVGDGKLTASMREQLAGRGFHKEGSIPSVVAPGDRVCFELNDMIKFVQVYKRWRDKKDMIQLLQTDLIGRLTGDSVSLDNFQILGDFVLVKPEVRGTGSKILLPDTMPKSPEFIYYRVVQIGSTVELPIKVGDEIIINHGKVNVLMFNKQNLEGTWSNDEYAYVIKDYVHGVVPAEDAEDGYASTAR